MSDIGDDFKALREIKRANKEFNRHSSTQMLADAGYQFETRNGGVHLIIKYRGIMIDYWPSTGKWIPRGGTASRGIRPLLTYLQAMKPQ